MEVCLVFLQQVTPQITGVVETFTPSFGFGKACGFQYSWGCEMARLKHHVNLFMLGGNVLDV